MYLTMLDSALTAVTAMRKILRNINLTFESGKLYAITGPNGGKTSIAKVIMGIYQPTQDRYY